MVGRSRQEGSKKAAKSEWPRENRDGVTRNPGEGKPTNRKVQKGQGLGNKKNRSDTLRGQTKQEKGPLRAFSTS